MIYLEKGKEFLKSLPTTVKIITAVMVLGIIIVSTLICRHNSQFTMVPLYYYELGSDNIEKIRNELNETGYKEGEDFSVVKEEESTTIEVQDILRSEMSSHLADVGLPQEFSEDMDTSGFTHTELERQWANIHNLSNDLARSITEMEGINGASIKIVPEEDALFQDQYKPAKATALLMIAPGYSVGKSQIIGITNLIAGSVKGLEPEKVIIVDNRGMDLSGLVNLNEDPLSLPANAERMSMQSSLEKELTASVQNLLDWGLGKDNSRVEVRVSLNFDQTERTSEVYGGPVNSDNNNQHIFTDDNKPSSILTIGGRTVYTDESDEVVPSGSGMHIICKTKDTESYEKGEGSEEGNFYKKESEAMNIDYDKFNTHVIETPGKVERISVALMLNNIPDKHVSEIKKVVMTAVNMEPSRGDTIAISNFSKKFDASEEMASMVDMAGNNETEDDNKFYTGIDTNLLYSILMFTVMLMSILLFVYAMKQKKSEKEKTMLCLENAGYRNFSGISDLMGDKIGNTVSPVKGNPGRNLTLLANQNPTEIANMLKSSWLSNS